MTDGPVDAVQRPERSGTESERCRTVADTHRSDHYIGRRIDLRERPGLTVRCPDCSSTDGDAARIGANRDAIDDDTLRRIDAQDRVVHAIRNPDGTSAHRETGGTPAHRHLGEDLAAWRRHETGGVRRNGLEPARARRPRREKRREPRADQKKTPIPRISFGVRRRAEGLAAVGAGGSGTSETTLIGRTGCSTPFSRSGRPRSKRRPCTRPAR